ncbi:MAG: type III pantothenate kinase, partial [Flavobacteriales bacterium]
MVIVLDIGNTRVKAGLFSGDRLLKAAAMPHGDAGAMGTFVAGAPAQRAAFGSVAGDDLPVLAALRERLPVERILPEGPLPIRTAYRTPGTLGIDRLANAVAAAARFPGRASLAIGLGTCIVHDLVDARGVHRGGAISPGFRMRAAAMHCHSATLPLVEPSADAP